MLSDSTPDIADLQSFQADTRPPPVVGMKRSAELIGSCQCQCQHRDDGALRELLSLEDKLRSSDDFQKLLLKSMEASTLYPNTIWRERVVQWYYDLVDHLQEDRSVVFIAMNILDRYLASMSVQGKPDEKAYKVSCVAAFFLAVRINGSVKLELPALVQLSGLPIALMTVTNMGRSIISKLSWDHRILPPSSFMQNFLMVFQDDFSESDRLDILESAMYLSEIAVFDPMYIGVSSSSIGFASLLVAIEDHCPAQSQSLLPQLSFYYTADDDLAQLALKLRMSHKESRDWRAEIQASAAFLFEPDRRLVRVPRNQDFLDLHIITDDLSDVHPTKRARVV